MRSNTPSKPIPLGSAGGSLDPRIAFVSFIWVAYGNKMILAEPREVTLSAVTVASVVGSRNVSNYTFLLGLFSVNMFCKLWNNGGKV